MSKYLTLCGIFLSIFAAREVFAAPPTYDIHIRNHLFHPSRLEIPANTKVRLNVINDDATPEEFESYELNREKVIIGHSRAIIFIGPLPPGEYPFFGEFNPKTAQGLIVVKSSVVKSSVVKGDENVSQ